MAAVAAGAYASVLDAMRAMSPRAEVVRPDPARRAFHEARAVSDLGLPDLPELEQ